MNEVNALEECLKHLTDDWNDWPDEPPLPDKLQVISSIASRAPGFFGYVHRDATFFDITCFASALSDEERRKVTEAYLARWFGSTDQSENGPEPELSRRADE